MNSIVMLDPKVHQHLKVDTTQVNAHAANQHLMPLVLQEFELAASNYPIVLTKRSDTGEFSAVALFGFERDENLFWRQSTWEASYVPLNVRRQPFFAADDPDQAKTIICLDKTSHALTEQQGQPLFSSDGLPSDYLAGVQTILQSLLEGQSHNALFIQKLIQLKLITPLTLDIQLAQDQEQTVGGLYTVDQEAFEQLDGAVVAGLHQAGLLKPLYAMMFSLNQVSNLVQRKAERAKAASAWFQ